ncbi:MAG TPA: GNAT family N-acetyltransferase [Anaerolineales bacterium]|nr:GNAT family N-acetyltransferase [Anaerolineales bacterium]
MVNDVLLDLGDGLVIRRGRASDADALAAFNARIHSDFGPENPDEGIAAWTRDLLTKPHPTLKPEDFTIVEEPESGKIVSSMNLISQMWSYAGIRFGVGRPELVGTLPEYRHRGLVRKQFDVVHQWSAARGELVLAITGIPYYYRLFGYEMGLSLHGGRVGYPTHVPRLPAGQPEPYLVRPAVEADLPFIARLYDMGCRRSLVACEWNEALWRYELLVKDPKNINRSELRVIERAGADGAPGEVVGFLGHSPFAWGDLVAATWYELEAGISWAAVTPSVVRYLEAAYDACAAAAPGPALPEGKKPFGGFCFNLGDQHPVYQVMGDQLPKTRRSYAWFVRVPDLPAFLTHISPVLEQRLAGSPLAGYSGDLKITFYRRGLHLVFEQGRLVKVKHWIPEPQGHSGDAAFPDLTFLHLLFGHRTLEALEYVFADCWVQGDVARALLQALFPCQPSDVWPVS